MDPIEVTSNGTNTCNSIPPPPLAQTTSTITVYKGIRVIQGTRYDLSRETSVGTSLKNDIINTITVGDVIELFKSPEMYKSLEDVKDKCRGLEDFVFDVFWRFHREGRFVFEKEGNPFKRLPWEGFNALKRLLAHVYAECHLDYPEHWDNKASVQMAQAESQVKALCWRFGKQLYLFAVLWTGKFVIRDIKGIVKPSGLMILDFDHVRGQGNMPEILAALRDDPLIFLPLLSPSGNGVKPVMRIPENAALDTAKFERCVQTIVRYFKANYPGLTPNLDKVAKSIATLCYYTYDPEAEPRLDAYVVVPDEEVAAPKPQPKRKTGSSSRRGEPTDGYAFDEYGPDKQFEVIESALQALVDNLDKVPDGPGERNKFWTSLGYAIGSIDDTELKEQAGDLLLELARENYGGGVQPVENALRNSRGDCSLGTLFHHAKVYAGWVPPWNGKERDPEDRWCIMVSVEEFKTKIPPVVTYNGLWHAQDRREVWQVIDRREYTGLAQSCLPYEHRNARNAELLLDTFEFECQVPPGRLKKACVWEDETQLAVIINCRNGLLKVTEGKVELMPYDWRKDWFSGQLLAGYVPEAKCDAFDIVFLEGQPKEQNRELVRWFFGYCIYPDLRYRIALVNYGPTTTGKTSTWYYGIGSVFGPGLTVNLALTDVCSEKGYSIPRLQHALINIGGELDADELTRSSRFKQIVGGESVEARSPYGKPFTMSDYIVKLVFCSNHLPRFKSGGEAELKRLKFVPWTIQVQKEQPELQLMIQKEIDGIFSCRMVPALQRLIGGWEPPEEADEAAEIREDFALANDPATMFGKKCCEFGRDFEEEKETLLKGFRLFVRETDLPSGLEDKAVFGRLLLQAFPGKVKSSRPWNDGDERKRVYKGIRLTPAWAAKIEEQKSYDVFDDEPRPRRYRT